MHRLHWGRIPVNFDQLFTPVSQAHSHATHAATRGRHIWQMASTVKCKRSLKHFGPKIWDSTDPSLYDISLPAFKRQLKDKLIDKDDRIVDFHYPILSCFWKMISVSHPNPVFVKIILSVSENCLKVYCDAQYAFLCCVYFASWGKITAGSILPLAKHDWLK